MGLNCTHGCYDGPYSYFNKFRKWVAYQIGFNLDAMEGFEGNVSFDTMDHPIKPLLNHSDCDGVLTPNQCRSIIKGAQMILEKIDVSVWNQWEVQLKAFSNGCKKAIKKNENVEFR